MGFICYLFLTCCVFLTFGCSQASSTGPPCPTSTCPPCPTDFYSYHYYHSYRYDWRGCQECYCEWTTISVPAAGLDPGAVNGGNSGSGSSGGSGSGNPGANSGYNTNGYYYTTTWDPRPVNYWSMSRSSLLSILVNLKQEAQSLIDTAKNTYDHILHSVIVNDIRKRRSAAKEDKNIIGQQTIESGRNYHVTDYIPK